MTKVISIAALIAGMATASFAGSLNTNTTIVEDDPIVPVGSSAGLAVPLAIGGALVAVGLIAGDDDEGTTATTTGATD